MSYSPPMPIARKTATQPTTLEAAASDYRKLLVDISTKRQILAGKQSASLAYQSVDGKVLRVAVVTKTTPVFYTWHNRNVEHNAPEINVSVGFATEAELVAARSMVQPAQAGQIDLLLRLLREGEKSAPPVRVEIVNAEQLAPSSKIAYVKRGDDGKLTGLVVESVPSPD
jgi:hypothetical protein